VTGLYPGHHGLVDNTFYDPSREHFYEMGIRERVTDPYYYGGMPLWRLARQQGLKSASYFWVGSELPDHNLNPHYFFPYKESTADTIRVEQVLSWLRLPAVERPHFITLYFSSPDHEAHLSGPLSDETKKAVLRADEMLGRLMAGLAKINLPVNVILVSDHGLLELKKIPETYIFLDEVLDTNHPALKISNGGTQAHLYLKDSLKIDSLYADLKQKAKTFSVFKQAGFPSRWHYKTQRSGNVLITANPGYYIVDKKRQTFLASIERGSKFGVHGYDPAAVKDMFGIFYAYGPNIKAGKKIQAFQNIHIYPFIAKILNLRIPEVDGDFKVLEPIFLENSK
jgi:alkaline phosphatase D